MPPKKRKVATYEKGAIPYNVSRPDSYWKIKKDLAPDVYWKKRYWRRRITGRGTYRRASSHKRIRGRGDYSMNAGDSFGRQWGGWLGSKAGEILGGGAQSLITGMVSGLGDYSIRKNAFLSGRLPEIVNHPTGGGTIIRFQEYLTDIISSATAGAFTIQNFIINAANTRTFPFLSQIAANYEQYEVEGLLFEFRSTSGNALTSANTALGSVMMATQYDTYDIPFASKLDMLNYEYATSTKPAESCVHMIECAPSQTPVNQLYCLYNQNVPANADARLYNLGRFSIASTGLQGTEVNMGELHITYQVRLLKPKLFVALGQEVGYFQQINGDNSTIGYTNALPLGTATYTTTPTSVKTNLGNAITITGNQVQFASTMVIAKYRLEVTWSGATALAVTYPVVSVSNLTNGSALRSPESGVTAGVVTYSLLVTTLGNGIKGILDFGVAGNLPSGNSNVTITLMQQTPVNL